MSDKKLQALKVAQDVFAAYMAGNVTINEVEEAYQVYIYA